MRPRIVFIGAHVEAEAPLRYLLESGEDVAGLLTLTPEAMRGMSGATDLAAIAAPWPSCQVNRVTSANGEPALEWISSLAPDLLLVIGWTRLIHDRLLAVPRIAPLGFHASMLPRYRGRAPVNWAIINGETSTGNTLMVLAAGADEGDIVAQREIPITFEDTCASVYRKVGETEVEMLAEVMRTLREGNPLPRRKQNPGHATVMPKRRPEDGVIDWNLPARKLYDWVRAQTHPYPGAFTYLDTGEKLWIWASLPSSRGTRAEPGTVEIDESGWPAVAAGSATWLRLISVQLEFGPEIMAKKELVEVLRQGGSRLGRFGAAR